MANLKEVRFRIASVNSTMQITNAMRMVSASKLRKAQNLIMTLRPYSTRLTALLEEVSGSEQIESPFHEIRPVNKIYLVVVTSNKGLCGAFNANIIKATRKRIEEIQEADNLCKIELITIGKRGTDFFRRTNIPILASYDEIFDDLTFEKASALAECLMEDFSKGKVDRIECVYNQFKNAAAQIIQDEVFLPIQRTASSDSATAVSYLFQPDKEGIIETLIPKTLKTQFFKIILDSFASEHGARMTTMHKATDNANELLKELKLSYNKARQASITNEIIEIVGGAEAS